MWCVYVLGSYLLTYTYIRTYVRQLCGSTKYIHIYIYRGTRQRKKRDGHIATLYEQSHASAAHPESLSDLPLGCPPPRFLHLTRPHRKAFIQRKNHDPLFQTRILTTTHSSTFFLPLINNFLLQELMLLFRLLRLLLLFLLNYRSLRPRFHLSTFHIAKLCISSSRYL